MLFELIATFAAGFMAAGVVLIINLTFKGALPKWAMPAFAGLAMIGYTIWSEYTWHDRNVAALPAGLQVASSQEGSAFWRPWTYLYPMKERFVAVDAASLQMHPATPDQRVVTLYFYARWAAPQPVPVAFNCAESSRTLLAEGAALTAEGTITGATWQPVIPGEPTLTKVCAELPSTL